MAQGKRVLLLGAGFSRNWGGWLADEALEYLLGCPEVDEPLRNLLVANKQQGFEGALGILQAQVSKRPSQQLLNMQAALRSMFADMNKAFLKRKALDFGNDSSGGGSITDFLRRFDVIFTLNQDTLLEMHYLGNVAVPAGDRSWQGACLPGMDRADDTGKWSGLWKPAPSIKDIPNDLQPYIKLHGSSNWQTGDDTGQLIIMGTNKPELIEGVPILSWSFEKFRQYLQTQHTRLMVIGYGFRDKHVNDVLEEAANARTIRLFVVDPNGMDAMDMWRHAHIPGSQSFRNSLWSVLHGCSRRSLDATFSRDAVEHSKLMRFITD